MEEVFHIDLPDVSLICWSKMICKMLEYILYTRNQCPCMLGELNEISPKSNLLKTKYTKVCIIIIS